jgi:hypothetical protein
VLFKPAELLLSSNELGWGELWLGYLTPTIMSIPRDRVPEVAHTMTASAPLRHGQNLSRPGPFSEASSCHGDRFP